MYNSVEYLDKTLIYVAIITAIMGEKMRENTTIFLDILINSGTIIAAGLASSALSDKFRNKVNNPIQGLFWGLVSILVMYRPLIITEGLFFDGSSVVSAISAFYYGPIAGIITLTISVLSRMVTNGPGFQLQTAVIVTATILGIIFNRIEFDKKPSNLYILGYAVHLTMLLCMLILPSEYLSISMKVMAVPILIVYPALTALVGAILNTYENNRKNLKLIESKENQLKAALEKVSSSERKFKDMFECAPVGIFLTDVNSHKFTGCNDAFKEIVGYSEEKLLNCTWDDITHELDIDVSQDLQNKMINGEKYYVDFNKRYIRFDGSQVWVNIKSRLLGNTPDENQQEMVFVQDITEQKVMEDMLTDYSYRDELTGLFNRRYFEKMLEAYDKKENLPLTIIVADVNGLKLVNDSFGHEYGDSMLSLGSDIFRKALRGTDLIARIGGDEFAMLLPNTDNKKAKMIIERIEDMSSKESIMSIDLSISFGFATKNNTEEDIRVLMRESEDQMYSRKFYYRTSIRSKSMESMVRALHEKSVIEEDHSKRVACLCESFGKVLGMSVAEIMELKNIAWLHDIGKIGVNELVLNKPGALDEDERKEIMRHPEIGYRIIGSINNTYHINEVVLSHHERWDGKGYPRGLKGEEIPYMARIVGIVDAYDAMTSDRVYRKAMSIDKALDEIRRGSGTQFDPNLASKFINAVTSCSCSAAIDSEELTA